MRYTFSCFGHKNIRATHHKTIEFTREDDLSPRGTCVLGVRADFDPLQLKRLSGRVRVAVTAEDVTDTFHATINPYFDDDREIVFRKSHFNSPRTLGIDLDKGADALRQDLVALLQNPQTRLEVTLETLTQDDTPPPL